MSARQAIPSQARALFASMLIGLAAALAAPGVASAAPELDLAIEPSPVTGIPAGYQGAFRVAVSNTGDENIEEPMTVDFTAPPGLKIVEVRDPLAIAVESAIKSFLPMWQCTIAEDQQSASCEGLDPKGAYPILFETSSPFPVEPGEEACELAIEEIGCPVLVVVKGDPGLESDGELTVSAEVSGGGAPSPDTAMATTKTWLPFDLISYEAANVDDEGELFARAGGRPYRSTVHFVTTLSTYFFGPVYFPLASQAVRDTFIDLPPGVVGNPRVAKECSFAQLTLNACPAEAQIGTLKPFAEEPELLEPESEGGAFGPLYNMVPSVGSPAEFGYTLAGAAVIPKTILRNGDDYGISFTTLGVNQLAPVIGTRVSFWGVPADPVHDAQRVGFGCPKPCASGLEEEAFLSLPTSCAGPQPVDLRAVSWLGEAEGKSVESSVELPANEGCAALDFSPKLEARPTTNVADSPTGLDVTLTTPQNADPNGLAEAHLRDATVTLPEGMTLNPAAANGLGTCSEAQFGFTEKEGETIHTTPEPVTCPNGSKLGTARIVSPLLERPLDGAVYLAAPYENPFGTLMAIYASVADVQRGVVVKIAGEVEADPDTGQLSVTIRRGPQLPFDKVELHLFGGAAGALRTPATCGEYSTTSVMTPWATPEAAVSAPSDTWAIAQAPGGIECPTSVGDLPNTPAFDAGTIRPVAGVHSPFVVHLRREDGSQNFASLRLDPPPGLLAKLAGTAICSDAALAAAAGKDGAQEKASASCPANSKLGTVIAGAGSGPSPYYVPGVAYLAGPYKGAPLSIAIVTPATAGPFDLGTVVVRVATHIDPRTTQITAISDPLPRILEGIPLDLRSVNLSFDRSEFTLNPTSCDPLAVTGLLTTTLGQSTALESRFQVGECDRLGFKPRVFLRLFGKRFGRGANPKLRAVLVPRKGDANISRAAVKMPRSLFLDQSHIRTVCTRVQFAADACPPGSIYGRAVATSPLVDYPLTGNVYLRSSTNKLPDLVADLRGPAHQPLRVELVGRTDAVKGALRSVFQVVPDAPVSRFVLELQAGRKSLLVASRNLCARGQSARVNLRGQNGRLSLFEQRINIPRCNRQRRRAARRRAAGKRRAARKQLRAGVARGSAVR